MMYEVQVGLCAYDTGYFSSWKSLGLFTTKEFAEKFCNKFREEKQSKDCWWCMYYSRIKEEFKNKKDYFYKHEETEIDMRIVEHEVIE